ncbi:MAG: hypothetical protein PF495_02015, partial [Spirochaetales bacterium]|nr:hypothetical protein [Spirochaetales bacterium]
GQLIGTIAEIIPIYNRFDYTDCRDIERENERILQSGIKKEMSYETSTTNHYSGIWSKVDNIQEAPLFGCAESGTRPTASSKRT